MPMLDHILQALRQQADTRPDISGWDPPLSGSIDIRIDRDGRWFHEGVLFQRESIARLFASLLKREADGYCLVTPVEKWRIEVEDVPFVASLEAIVQDAGGQQVFFRTSLGEVFRLDAGHPLVFRGEPRKPYVTVRDGLEARISRAAYYQLSDSVVEQGGQWGVVSAGHFFVME